MASPSQAVQSIEGQSTTVKEPHAGPTGPVTPQATPGADDFRLAPDRNAKEPQAAPATGLATPRATPGADDIRLHPDAGATESQPAPPDGRDGFRSEVLSATPTMSHNQPPGIEVTPPKEDTGTKKAKQLARQGLNSMLNIGGSPRRKYTKRRVQKLDKDNKPLLGADGKPEYEEMEWEEEIAPPTQEPFERAAALNQAGAKATASTRFFGPGFTREGEPILRYRTIGADRNGDPKGYQFVLQTGIVMVGNEEKPRCELKSGSEIGRVAAQGYLGLNTKKRIGGPASSREQFSKRDEKCFHSLEWVAAKPIQTKKAGSGFRFPDTLLCMNFEDKETHERWQKDGFRTDLRSMRGTTDADKDITDYYLSVGLTPPWKFPPERISINPEDADKDGGIEWDPMYNKGGRRPGPPGDTEAVQSNHKLQQRNQELEDRVIRLENMFMDLMSKHEQALQGTLKV